MARRRNVTGRVWDKLLPGCLVGLPVCSVRKRRDRDDLTVIKTRKSRVDQFIGPHQDLARQMRGRQAGGLPEIGSGGTRQNSLDAHVLPGKLPIKRKTRASTNAFVAP